MASLGHMTTMCWGDRTLGLLALPVEEQFSKRRDVGLTKITDICYNGRLEYVDVNIYASKVPG